MFIGRQVAMKVKLVDRPGGRKNHDGDIPLIGGILIYVVILFGSLLSPSTSSVILQILLLSGPVVIVGFIDDLRSVGWRIRLVIQTLSCVSVIAVTELYVKDLGSFAWIVDIELGTFGIPFTIFAVVGLTNAFNMIDGHDGFAGFAVLTAVLGMMLFGGP
ncbi:MAG: undecaprenyl-phosphate alpha-N-acetylglucosaminyl 1-phosphate transferase, partial [Candidatus Puniceispirillaceae bacterium]